MTKVKICGITNIDDARQAATSGADALGFVFFAQSPRFISPEEARSIIATLPPFITTVGLFVNETPERIRDIADFCAIDVLQLHGDEPPEECSFAPRRVIKALRVKDADSLTGHESFVVSALLLDAWVAKSYGGTGHRCNWDLAAIVARERNVLLAGGLTPENVAEAVRLVRPYGVDVSSGVESSPGRKDSQKVMEFIRKAKAA